MSEHDTQPAAATTGPGPADRPALAELLRAFRAEVSHPGVLVACPSDLLDGLPEAAAAAPPDSASSGTTSAAATSSAAMAAPEADEAVPQSPEARQAAYRRAWAEMAQRLAARGIQLLRAGGAAPVTAAGVIDATFAFRFRSRGASCQLWVYAPDAPVVVRHSRPPGADRDEVTHLRLGAVGFDALVAARQAHEDFLERWSAWYHSTDDPEADDPDEPRWTEDYLDLDPVPDGVVWVGHIDGAADFGWTGFGASALSLEALERLLVRLVDAARPTLPPPGD